MANVEHLAILKQGVEVWNKWRLENPNIRPDLWEANLKDTDLRGFNLANATFFQADLYETDFRNADLRNVCFFGASLYNSNFQEADLRGSDLSRVEIYNVDFSEANLSNTNLSETNVQHGCSGRVYFIKTNLSKANLSWSNLSYCDFSYSHLSGSNLVNSDLSGCKFNATNLSGANLCEVNLNKADLSNANTAGANLVKCILSGANLCSVNLTGAFIKDWQINSETQLDDVICEYIYIGHDDDYEKTTKRRPINGNFAPGEFSSLYKKIIETTDLILRKTPQSDNTINNQGIQFYSNSTIHIWKNLRFRSKAEIKIAEALDRTGVLFVPNSLARLNTSKGRENKEADFLICYNGKWGVLEVDGPFHTAERRVEEQERERIFKKNGIKVVERFDSERCYNNPDEVVQEFFKMIEIGYS